MLGHLRREGQEAIAELGPMLWPSPCANVNLKLEAEFAATGVTFKAFAIGNIDAWPAPPTIRQSPIVGSFQGCAPSWRSIGGQLAVKDDASFCQDVLARRPRSRRTDSRGTENRRMTRFGLR